MIGIIAALPVEARCFSAKNNLLLQVSGMGAERAQVAALNLVARGASLLISWGTAGGLAPGARPGLLVLPQCVMDQYHHSFDTDPHWHHHIQERLAGQLAINTGVLLQANHVISSVAEKQRLFAQYQAVAVDMESAAIAAVAQQAGLPFIAIRSIVDVADFALPAWLQQCMHPSGQIGSLALTTQLCQNPLRLLPLWQLWRAFSVAMTTLNLMATAGLPISEPVQSLLG